MEFQKVMRQWRRFCKSHSNCGECEFDGKGICGEAHLTDIPYADIELRIMAWAAEHPEPKYTTWAEWLLKFGAARRVPIGEPWPVEFADGSMLEPCYEIVVKENERIPADIAQKLGIEPKEG